MKMQFMDLNARNQSGMTLLEVLVALVIFTIIAVAGYSGLQQGVAVQNQLQDQQVFWRKLDAVVMLIEQDLMQSKNIAPRVPLWDKVAFKGYGNNSEESFGEFIKFTRGGNKSFLVSNVSPFQRTAFRLREGVLYRVTWPGLDLPEHETGTETALLENLQGIELRYLTENKRWVDTWPLRFTEEEALTLPEAVELTLTISDNQLIKRVFYVGHPG